MTASPALDAASFLETVGAQIIPRLALVQSPAITPRPPSPSSVAACATFAPSDADVAELARICAANDLPRALAMVEQLAPTASALEAALLDLIAEAARLLGRQWDDDTTTFTEVTIGTGTLQHLVHVLGPRFAGTTLRQSGVVVLVAAPQEQHTFGLHVAAEFLRRDGWGVDVVPAMSLPELVDLVSSQHVDAVGITASSLDLMKPIARMVAGVRKASRNAGLRILLGGAPELRPLATKLGAAFCADARDALIHLHSQEDGAHDG